MILEKWYSSKKIRQILQITPLCLYEMRKSGRILAKKISGRKYLFKLPKEFLLSFNSQRIAIYARVSTPKQKKDLDNLISLLRLYVVKNGYVIDNDYVFSDIASGMNENRRGLNSMITEILIGNISKVIVASKDRLTRFGFGYLRSLFERYNCEIIEVNLTEEKTFEQELTDDLIAIIHHFSMKFYGKRKSKLRKLEEDLRKSDTCDCDESK